MKTEDQSSSEEAEAEPVENDKNNPEGAVAKPWIKKVKDGFVSKVPKDVQKRRRNFRLKKMIAPKAPVMILHEMLGNVQYDVAEPLQHGNPNIPMMYIAKTEYDGKQFAGNGPSKSIAKNFAAESVLQYITAQSCNKSEKEAEDDKGEVRRHTLETDTPWSALASLAMFKLFNDWQSQGFVLPPGLVSGGIFHQQNQNVATDHQNMEDEKSAEDIDNFVKGVKKEKFVKQKPVKSLPENPTSRHPVQLLNEMKGQLEYFDAGTQGIPPNCIFTLAVTVDDQTFSGTAKTKKEAKKIAAEEALLALYDVNYHQ